MDLLPLRPDHGGHLGATHHRLGVASDEAVRDFAADHQQTIGVAVRVSALLGKMIVVRLEFEAHHEELGVLLITGLEPRVPHQLEGMARRRTAALAGGVEDFGLPFQHFHPALRFKIPIRGGGIDKGGVATEFLLGFRRSIRVEANGREARPWTTEAQNLSNL